MRYYLKRTSDMLDTYVAQVDKIVKPSPISFHNFRLPSNVEGKVLPGFLDTISSTG